MSFAGHGRATQLLGRNSDSSTVLTSESSFGQQSIHEKTSHHVFAVGGRPAGWSQQGGRLTTRLGNPIPIQGTKEWCTKFVMKGQCSFVRCKYSHEIFDDPEWLACFNLKELPLWAETRS